jgi:hypothetical protein
LLREAKQGKRATQVRTSFFYIGFSSGVAVLIEGEALVWQIEPAKIGRANLRSPE